MSDIFYFVSSDPDRITHPEYNRDHMVIESIDHPHYQTAQSAIDAIKEGSHGPSGTLYVIKAELDVEATAVRGWELRMGEKP